MQYARYAVVALVFASGAAQAQQLRDRGPGQPTSMFGTFIRGGELMLYPFFEYYLDHDAEYKPEELGYGLDQDFRGKYRASEGLIWFGYGITDWLAVEFEAAVISARLEKSPNDTSAMPPVIEESGLGDVEGQLRFRFSRETERTPEFFGLFEFVLPTQGDRVLIGTPGWELKGGVGVIRGFPWGTLSVRTEAEYDAAESTFELGEFAVEYLRRLSPIWRIYVGIEGAQDEIEFIPEVQWHFAPFAYLKLNSAFGLTSKATDWAPEIGVMFSIY